MSKIVNFRHSRPQRGVSLFGMLIFAIVLVAAVVIGMRVLPTALEFMAAKRAIERVVSTGETNPSELRKSFDRFAAVDDIVTITGKDLNIDREGDKVRVSFAYEKRIPLFGLASLLLDYKASAP